MGALSARKDLKSFWQNMSLEEESHVKFWKKLLVLTEQGSVPEIFQHSEKVRSELESINQKVDVLFSELRKSKSEISRMFLIAYRMEFYLLHPAFERLFFYAGHCELIKPNPEDQYENHIREFIDALSDYGASTPEMELLGETIERLWHENKSLAKLSLVDPLTRLLNRRGF